MGLPIEPLDRDRVDSHDGDRGMPDRRASLIADSSARVEWADPSIPTVTTRLSASLAGLSCFDSGLASTIPRADHLDQDLRRTSAGLLP